MSIRYINNFFSDLELFGVKLGLEQTQLLFEKLGNPERKLRFIHIAGTNGKGSVASMIAAALSAAGFKVGFYSSPHLIDIRERFRIDGQAISEEELLAQVNHIEPLIRELRKSNINPTYFEVTTAIAAAYFADQNVDFALWEVGMGGRFDATNIVTPELAVITGIALDHTSYLGNSIADIAREKAGIIKLEKPTFCGLLPEGAEKIIAAVAEKKSSPLYLTVPYEFSEEKDTYKDQNRRLAVRVIQYLASKFDFDYESAIKGGDCVAWPARMQELDNGVIIDGAHNPQAGDALVGSLETLYPNRKYSIIFAALHDKESTKLLRILARIAEEFIFPEFHCSRGATSAEELKTITQSVCDLRVKVVEDLSRAYEEAEGSVLITGSLYLAGAALRELVGADEVLNIYRV